VRTCDNGLTVTFDALPDETPQKFAAQVAERRRSVVVNGEIVRARTHLTDRRHSCSAPTTTTTRRQNFVADCVCVTCLHAFLMRNEDKTRNRVQIFQQQSNKI